jgi:hypothetical protein
MAERTETLPAVGYIALTPTIFYSESGMRMEQITIGGQSYQL